jgi:hypothetical protein
MSGLRETAIVTDQNFAILEVRNVGLDLDQVLLVFEQAAKIKQ